MQRSFLDRLRNPDEGFLSSIRVLAHMLPLGLAFLATCIFIVSIIAGAVSDKESSFLVLVQWLSLYGMRLIVVLIAASIIVLQGLKIYVLVKLRKGRNSYDGNT